TRNIIGKEIKEANIYSVFADTTPDISHQDRLALCVRYFNSRGKAVERLLEMEKGTDKTGLGTTSQIINILETGHKITFIPCQAHRLNTFLEHSCGASSIIGNTIDTLEYIYVFFSSSNKRYCLLHEKISKIENALQLTRRNLSRTRWTARAESVKAVWNSLEAVIESLDEIQSLNKCFDKGTRCKALEINSDDHTMNNFINSAKEFAILLGTDPEADFKYHHRKRLAPKRYDSWECEGCTCTDQQGPASTAGIPGTENSILSQKKPLFIINAWIVLHNMCIEHNIIEVMDETVEDLDLGMYHNQEPLNEHLNDNRNRNLMLGRRQRDRILEFLQNRNVFLQE
ncbi:Uncharacterized protein FWK35_00029818, partial [Aphis craccivora]